MRERLAKDKGATYTYSMDYVSQTISLVDEFRLKEDQEVIRVMSSVRRPPVGDEAQELNSTFVILVKETNLSKTALDS